MKTIRISLFVTLAATFCMVLAGCDNPPVANGSGDHGHSHADGHDHGDHGHSHGEGGHDHGEGGHSHGDGGHDHDHGDAGHGHGDAPHHGFLFDIGNDHEYHGEIVKGPGSDVVTIYLMDKALKAISIDQSTISLTLTSGEKSGTFELKTDGESGSQFTVKDDAVTSLLDRKGVTGKLRLKIEDKPFVGKFDYEAPHAH